MISHGTKSISTIPGIYQRVISQDGEVVPHSGQPRGSPYPARSSASIVPTAVLTRNMFVD